MCLCVSWGGGGGGGGMFVMLMQSTSLRVLHAHLGLIESFTSYGSHLQILLP